MTASEELSQFIASSFRSVWALEVLLLLKRKEGFHPRDELIANLRGSELVVEQALASLVAAGLVAADEHGGAAYMPVSPETDQLVDRTAELYERRPNAVRRMIVSASAPGLNAFADAFRLRKD